jgi:IS4 transposase
MELKPEEIAAIYKHRWKIELFFKWIKQHLKITAFWGRTENAVKTQVYIAVITYTLIAIIKQKLKSAYSTYEILQVLGTSLLDKTPINQLLQKKNNQDVKELLYKQLKIF